MSEISCFYIHFNRTPMHITFIKFEKYFIVCLCNDNAIAISFETFMKIPYLFDFYILSLFLTEDTQQLHIRNDTMGYYTKTRCLWKRMCICNGYEFVHIDNRNLLNKREPTRETSNKKIRKFIKYFNRIFQEDDPIEILGRSIYPIINEEQQKLEKVLDYNNKISLLTGIKKKYGIDIYYIVRRHL